jgi:hypothetical protein
MTVSRVTLPAEFFDITSDLMLVQPQPQFFYANLLFAGQAKASLAALGAFGSDAARAIASGGAGVPALQDMQLKIADSPMAAAIRAVVELGNAKTGHTIRINRPVLSGGGYTEASRTIASTAAISTTPIDLSSEQVSITIRRVVGPFASGGSVPQPMAIDKMDAQRSVHSLVDLVGLNLVYDRTAYADGVLKSLFDSGANTVFPGTNTTDATSFVVNGDAPMDMDTLWRAEQKLMELNIPRFADGTYALVLSPQQARQLKADPDYAKLAVFRPESNPLGHSLVGQLGSINVYVSNTYVTDTATVSGVTIHHGCMFGPGAIGWGVGQAPTPAYANEDNYGETAKVVWIAYEGSAVMDNRFIVNIHTD